MKRQHLRNRTPKFRGVHTTEPYQKPKPKRSPRFGTALVVLGILALLALLWETLPQECKTIKTEVPRYCVD